MPALTAEGWDGTVRPVMLGPRLGRGGEGEVFEEAGLEGRVVKLFMPGMAAAKADKIAAMLARPPVGMVESHDRRQIVQIAWPLEAIRNAVGEFRGFTMPAVDFSATADLISLSSTRARSRNNLPEDYRFRVYAARNLAALVGHLHSAGHQIIDTKPHNLRVYRDGAFVCLLDCDGYAVSGPHRRYPALVRTPEFLAPEAFDLPPEELGEPQDRFGLAVLLFELLANGVHPASGRDLRGDRPLDLAMRTRQRLFFIDPRSRLGPPFNSIYSALPEDTRALFSAAFLGAAEARPSAGTWASHLEGLITRLQVCERDPSHVHPGRSCPWCALGLGPADRVGSPGPPPAAAPHDVDKVERDIRWGSGRRRHRVTSGSRWRRGRSRRRAAILVGGAVLLATVLGLALGRATLRLAETANSDPARIAAELPARRGPAGSPQGGDLVTSRLAPQLEPAQVARAKAALASLGFEPGPIDPTMDERFVLAWRQAVWRFGAVARNEDAAAVLDRLERRALLEGETREALLALGVAPEDRTALLAKVSEAVAQGTGFVTISGRLLRLFPAEGCLELQTEPLGSPEAVVRLCGLEGGGMILCRVQHCLPGPGAIAGDQVPP